MRKNNKWISRTLSAALIAALSLGALSAAAAMPAKVDLKSGVTVLNNALAAVDTSNLAEGLLSIKYTGGKKVVIKVQITKTGTTETYTYSLNNSGSYETFPLTEGDGDYSVKVLENTSGTKYAVAYSTTVTLKLRNQFAPFLYSNQYVNYTGDSKTAAKAAELVKGKSDDLAKVTEVYHYVVNNVSYDYELAKTVKSGYLPNVDSVLASGKGICFDYAALTTAMLRSQGIPCKLVVGYAGKVYHAWISVYISGSGWVDNLIYFDGSGFSRMDPTFVSSAKGNADTLKYVGDGSNYTQKYAY